MIKLRSFSLTILFIPFVFCGQNQQTGKENGLGKLFKKIVDNIENLDSKTSKTEKIAENNEKTIVGLWKNYSKSFEYKDYDQLASYFNYPVVLSFSNDPVLADNKERLIQYYKRIREDQIQSGYKYSLMDSYEFHELSDGICVLKVIYSRFDNSYNKIYTGSGLYYYIKISGVWKLYAFDSL